MTTHPLPTTPGGYATILADPPWRFTNRHVRGAPESHRGTTYETMHLDDVKALPVAAHAAPNAHLYLWCPNSLLPDGLDVITAWGFTYKTQLAWVKTRADGAVHGGGLGWYFRSATEALLFAIRGHSRTLPPARATTNVITARTRGHSVKPDEQYDLIGACSPGPRLELFARRPWPGWDAYGDQATWTTP